MLRGRVPSGRARRQALGTPGRAEHGARENDLASEVQGQRRNVAWWVRALQRGAAVDIMMV